MTTGTPDRDLLEAILRRRTARGGGAEIPPGVESPQDRALQDRLAASSAVLGRLFASTPPTSPESVVEQRPSALRPEALTSAPPATTGLELAFSPELLPAARREAERPQLPFSPELLPAFRQELDRVIEQVQQAQTATPEVVPEQLTRRERSRLAGDRAQEYSERLFGQLVEDPNARGGWRYVPGTFFSQEVVAAQRDPEVTSTFLPAVLSALEIYHRNVIEPAAAFATVAVQQLIPGLQEIESKVRDNMAQGQNLADAVTNAYRDSDLPWGVKGAIEFFSDPLIFLPAAAGVTKGARTAGALFLNRLEAQLARSGALERLVPSLSARVQARIGARRPILGAAPDEVKTLLERRRIIDAARGTKGIEGFADPDGIIRVFKRHTIEFDELVARGADDKAFGILIGSRGSGARLKKGDTWQAMAERHLAFNKVQATEARAQLAAAGLEELGVPAVAGAPPLRVAERRPIAGAAFEDRGILLHDPAPFVETVARANIDDNVKYITRFLTQVRGVGTLVRVIGGKAAVARTGVEKAGVGYYRALADSGQRRILVRSFVEQYGTLEQVLGKFGEDLIITKGTFKGENLFNFFEDLPRLRPKMNQAQIQQVEMISRLNEEVADQIIRAGIDLKKLPVDEGNLFASRVVVGKTDAAGNVIAKAPGLGGGRFAGKPGFVKKRIFKLAEEDREAGFRLLNPLDSLDVKLQAADRVIARKGFEDYVLTQVPWRVIKTPEATLLAFEGAQTKLEVILRAARAVADAFAGKRLAPGTVNSVRRVFPKIGEGLQQVARSRTDEEAGAILQRLEPIIGATRRNVQNEVKKARADRAAASREARRSKFEEVEAFPGIKMTGPEARETARVISESLGPQGGTDAFVSFLKSVNQVNAVGRMFQLGMDFSTMMIQLILAPYNFPKAYAKGGVTGLRAMLDPRVHARYLADNADLIQRMPGLILTRGGQVEFTEALGRGGLLTKGPLALAGKPLKPFQRFFETSLDVAGVEMGKSLVPLGTSVDDIGQLTDFINEFRGLVSTQALGVGATQRQIEALLLLAPRYNRAVASLLFDVFRRNLRGQRARMALIRGLGGLSATAVAFSLARGESMEEALEHLNPTSPRFFTWLIAGQNIGPGSKIRSVIVLAGRMAKDPERIPILARNFGRGNLAPVISKAVDIGTGRDFIGEPTREGAFKLTPKTILTGFTPIWLQAVLFEGGDAVSRAIRVGPELLGARTYPQSKAAEFAQYAEQVLGHSYGDIIKPGNIKDSVERQRVILEFKQLKIEDRTGKALWELKLEEAERRGRTPEMLLAMTSASDNRLTIMKEQQRLLDVGQIGHQSWRNAFQATGQDFSAGIEMLELVPAFRSDFERLRETRADEAPEQELYRRYIGIITDPDLDRGVDDRDYDEQERRLLALREEAGDFQWDFLMDFVAVQFSKFGPAAVEYFREIVALDSALRKYWGVADEVLGEQPGLKARYDSYVKLDPDERKEILSRNPRLQMAVREITRRRGLMRETNQVVDALLKKWGYTTVFKNPINLAQ